ncbi:MAG: hypothetical protein H7Y14_13750 [Burkholderiales bacterium]|nr:hypothetical protein [Burkholderiales bacterium]
MDPIRIDDEAHRTLEQHALRNVQSLAERLGYRDLMDRRTEKAAIIAIGIVAVALVLFFTARVMMTAPPPGREERTRCELDARVSIVWDRRKALRAENPGITERELEHRVAVTHEDVKTQAASQCAGAAKPG